VKATLAAVLHRHGREYLREHPLSTPQAKAWRAICACRTPALDVRLLAYSECAHRHWQYHSCRNRRCPICGARTKESWLQARLAHVLDVPYTHLVFALPHEFNTLYYQQSRMVIDALFASVQQTLSAFAANPRWMGVAGGHGALTLVLYTLEPMHIHMHASMFCWVLAPGPMECAHQAARLSLPRPRVCPRVAGQVHGGAQSGNSSACRNRARPACCGSSAAKADFYWVSF